MINYLEKYNSLPANLRDAISTPEAMQAIGEIEQYYNVSLATVVMRVMVKDISIVDLPKFFVFEYNMEGRAAETLVAELKERVFVKAADYLGITIEAAQPSPEAEIDDWLQDRQEEAGVRSSNFFFSPDDEEEVKELSRKVEGYKNEISKNQEKNEQQLQEQVNRIIYKMNLNFSSDELHSRYWQVVYTYIKGVRNKIDTRHTLMKDVDVGGVGLNDALADRTIATADQIKQENVGMEKEEKQYQDPDKGLSVPPPADAMGQKPSAKNAGIEAEPAISGKDGTKPAVPAAAKLSAGQAASLGQAGARDFDYDFSALKKQAEEAMLKEKNIKPGGAAEKIEPEHSGQEQKPAQQLHTINLRLNGAGDGRAGKIKPNGIAKPSQAGEEPKGEMPGIEANGAAKKGLFGGIKISNRKEKSPDRGAPLAAGKRIKTKNGKVRVEDVRYMPKLTGPIDELKEMDPLNFRRLNQDADTAAAKIKEKIEFLEEDSYAKKLEAIQAWRQSPVNQLYLNIGKESINKHKGINEVIDELKSAKQEYLSNAEFKAVMRLNNNLRF